MEKRYIVFGGFSVLLGILLLFFSKVFTAKMELIHGVGINDLKEYSLVNYPIACFGLGALFILLAFFKKI